MSRTENDGIKAADGEAALFDDDRGETWRGGNKKRILKKHSTGSRIPI